jgi:hypothetical protein
MNERKRFHVDVFARDGSEEQRLLFVISAYVQKNCFPEMTRVAEVLITHENNIDRSKTYRLVNSLDFSCSNLFVIPIAIITVGFLLWI